MRRRNISTFRTLRHENPLGLPRKGTPPNLVARMQKGLPERRTIPNVRKIIAVSSAKGGVGKSTIAANLALAFVNHGYRSGVLDTDIFGPSIPLLFNLADASEPRVTHANRLIPLTNYGVKTMSMGYLVRPESAVVWRGMMVMKALQQLLHEVDWGGLDVLVLDLPPGTGDTQLTISQQIVLDGALLVSTPQQLSLADSLRGVRVFKQMQVPILGMVQNMSVFVCPNCDTPHHIFDPRRDKSGSGYGEDISLTAQCVKHGIDLLGDVPLDSEICRHADGGAPSVVAEPNGPAAKVFMELAGKVAARLGL